MGETALKTPRSVRKEGQEVLPGTRAEIALQPMVKTVVRQLCPHARAGGCTLNELGTSWRAHTGEGSWQLLQPLERGTHTEAGFLAGLLIPQGPRAGAGCS